MGWHSAPSRSSCCSDEVVQLDAVHGQTAAASHARSAPVLGTTCVDKSKRTCGKHQACRAEQQQRVPQHDAVSKPVGCSLTCIGRSVKHEEWSSGCAATAVTGLGAHRSESDVRLAETLRCVRWPRHAVCTPSGHMTQ